MSLSHPIVPLLMLFLTTVKLKAFHLSALKQRIIPCTSALRLSSRSMGSAPNSVSISIPDALRLHGQEQVVFVDGSWFLNSQERNARQAFESGPRIQDAVFFDIDDIATPHDSLIHMMPDARLFGAAMDAMSITKESMVIVYGQEQCPMVHRAWYTFLAMGHELGRTKLLDGSVADWKFAGGPVDMTPTTTLHAKDIVSSSGCDMESSQYEASGPHQVVDRKHVLEVVQRNMQHDSDHGTIIIDARSSERFYAQAPEPRPGLRLGHMPGARNVFFASLLQPDNVNRLAPRSVLLERFAQAQIPVHDGSKQFITSCGSGATACTVAAALIECGVEPSRVSIYDGSWMEWGAHDSSPIVTTDE